MGFPLPATDYIETTLTPETLYHIDANCTVIETDIGYAVIDRSIRPASGDQVLTLYDERCQFAKWMGRSLITDDGEAIEGEALDGVTVFGVLTYTINSMYEDDDVV